MTSVIEMSEQMSEPPWIRSYALTPRRLTDGGWVWLSPYEWRWERPSAHLPSAVNPPRVRSRKAALTPKRDETPRA